MLSYGEKRGRVSGDPIQLLVWIVVDKKVDYRQRDCSSERTSRTGKRNEIQRIMLAETKTHIHGPHIQSSMI